MINPTRTHLARRWALLLQLALVFAAAPHATAATAVSGWVENWSLPLFSDEGFRTMTARGSKARPDTANNRVEVIDLNLTLFSGDATKRVETILLSPAATFLPHDKSARGSESVRFISFDPHHAGEAEIEASGTKWEYLHEQKKISLDGNVRVTFHAELKELF